MYYSWIKRIKNGNNFILLLILYSDILSFKLIMESWCESKMSCKERWREKGWRGRYRKNNVEETLEKAKLG